MLDTMPNTSLEHKQGQQAHYGSFLPNSMPVSPPRTWVRFGANVCTSLPALQCVNTKHQAPRRLGLECPGESAPCLQLTAHTRAMLGT